MKKKFLYTLLLTSIIGYSQIKLITKNGKVTFEASVPAFEEVKAKNESVTCVLNTENGEIAALALTKGFRFRIALMEEHFNENYIESDKYPKATFKEYTIKGKLEMHGKTKDISIIAKLKKTEAGLEIDSNFLVNTDDFDIEIPSVVSKKVSKKVNVILDFLLK